jgi:hypothetical protein
MQLFCCDLALLIWSAGWPTDCRTQPLHQQQQQSCVVIVLPADQLYSSGGMRRGTRPVEADIWEVADVRHAFGAAGLVESATRRLGRGRQCRGWGRGQECP